jgi:hypothetical protein
MRAVANVRVSPGSLENERETIEIISPQASSTSKATVDKASPASTAKPAPVLELNGKEASNTYVKAV